MPTCAPGVEQPERRGHHNVKDIKEGGVQQRPLAQANGRCSRRQPGQVKNLEYKGKDIGPRADSKNIVFAVVHISVTFAEDLLDA